MTQKAARFYGAKKLFVEDVPLPTIKPQCVIVEVAACGICGVRDLCTLAMVLWRARVECVLTAGGPERAESCPKPTFTNIPMPP
jgi:D-arabinose 1-dehydrogenase-like Zn-dependent alcohol dehydrogenase